MKDTLSILPMIGVENENAKCEVHLISMLEIYGRKVYTSAIYEFRLEPDEESQMYHHEWTSLPIKVRRPKTVKEMEYITSALKRYEAWCKCLPAGDTTDIRIVNGLPGFLR